MNLLTPGERVEDLIREKGGSITGDAEKIGTSQCTLSDFINGKRSIRSDTLKKLCEYYNVSSDYILGLSDVPSPNAEIRAICETTGLSEKTVSKLHDLQINGWTYISCFLDYIVAYPELEKLILAIHQKNESDKLLKNAIIKGAGNDFEVPMSSVYQTYIEREFQAMIKGFILNIEEANDGEK